MKKLNLLALCLMISACANIGDYEPRYYYSSIVVANLTGATISEVKVEVGPGGQTVACAEVTNDELCQQRFPRRPYPEQTVQLSYQTGAGEAQSKQMNPAIPITLDVGNTIRLMLDIHADGSVKAYFKEDDLSLSE
jgi:hypothetical protein